MGNSGIYLHTLFGSIVAHLASRVYREDAIFTTRLVIHAAVDLMGERLSAGDVAGQELHDSLHGSQRIDQ